MVIFRTTLCNSKAIPALLLLLCCITAAFAQKKPLDYAAFTGWPEISGEKISDDGRFVIYSIRSRSSGANADLYIKATDNNWQRQLKNASQWSITTGNRYVVYIKGMDSVVVYDPVKDTREMVLPGNSYQLTTNANKLVLACFQRAGKMLHVYDVDQKKTRSFSSIENMELSANGEALVMVADSSNRKLVKWVDLSRNNELVIAKGSGRFANFTFDKPALQIAFTEDIGSVTEPGIRLRYYKKGTDSAVVKARSNSPGIDSGYVLQAIRPRFNAPGTKLFFNVGRKTGLLEKDKAKADITVWHYNDVYLPGEQSFYLTSAGSYPAVAKTGNDTIIQLARFGNNVIIGDLAESNGDFMIVSTRFNLFSVDNSAANTPSHYLVNTSTGSRVLLVSQKDNMPVISPGAQFAVWYDPLKDGYYSYEIKTGRKRNITAALKGLLRPAIPNGRLIGTAPYGLAGWLPGDTDALIYDEYDIWKVDVLGIRQPLNITKGYGRRHKTILRIWASNKDYEATLIDKPTILLNAFATETRKNGFFLVDPQQSQEPALLMMDDCLYYAHGRFNFTFLQSSDMYKAADADVYLLRRSRANQFPDLFATSDFKKLTQLTTVRPEAEYNWIKAELIQYKLPGGRQSAAVLYKPENFDPAKKYPVIFYIYEKLSYKLHQYISPATADGSLNIPFLVSNGYLICTPDIEYTKGKTGESALQYVTAAAAHLRTLPYVNAAKMGIQGHSFGGYQVNYIVSRSNLFAAAQPSAGASDFISYYNGNYRASSGQFYFEVGQGRIGNTMWEKPELFQQNSPVFNANNVTTPVLIMHNKDDAEVPFQQGLEWFTALKRLGKKVWLLQYDKEQHGIVQQKNRTDYTIRMKQFFDHYLKGAAQPIWMKQGIPAALKDVEDGLGY
jgi:dienelactone hydrolase